MLIYTVIYSYYLFLQAIDCLLYTKDNIVTKEGPKSRLLLPVYKNMAKAEKLKPKSEVKL